MFKELARNIKNYQKLKTMYNLNFNPYLKSDDVFGKYYVGSTKCRQRQIKRKKLAKQQGRKLKH